MFSARGERYTWIREATTTGPQELVYDRHTDPGELAPLATLPALSDLQDSISEVAARRDEMGLSMPEADENDPETEALRALGYLD
jgi:hypothetical protein